MTIDVEKEIESEFFARSNSHFVKFRLFLLIHALKMQFTEPVESEMSL